MNHYTPTTVYTTKDAAPRLHPELSPRTLERWRRSGRGPKFVQIGRRVGYTDEALEDYKRQQTRSHTAEGR
jgi:hypothetical protein